MEKLEKSSRFIDADGRLRVDSSPISKETINPYYGKEVPNYYALGLEPEKIYYLYRPGKELQKAADSFNGVQIVEKHTPMFADSPNKDLVIGTTGTDSIFEAPYLKNTLFFWDEEAIAAIEAADKKLGGMKELSCGYAYEAIMEPGEFEGEKYDGWMKNIVGNHVALVETGRAGHDVKVSDNNPFKKENELEMKKNKLHKKAFNKIKAMDIDISEQQLDNLLDVVLGVEQENEAENNPEAITADVEEDSKQTAKKMLKDKGFSDEEIAKICGMLENKGMDEDTDDNKENDNKEDKKTEDEESETDNKKNEADMKKAMDEMATSIRESIRSEFAALEQAKNDVRPLIGEVSGIDNAENVYRFALDALSIKHDDLKEITSLKRLCEMQISQENNKRFEVSNLAMDKDNGASFLTKSISRVKI